ncbi:MAG: NAD(P)/FAD-dependent oxidoreductase, partial [Alphaproteobacteria bacterium]
RGLSVLVLERTGIAAEASGGNAGAFAFSDILPLASPGMIRKAPWWLLDRHGPLAIPPRYAHRIAPWLFRFWRASRPDRFAAGATAQAALNNLSRDRLALLMDDTGLHGLLNKVGNLEVYETEAEFAAAEPKWALRADNAIAFEHLASRDAIAEKQPGLHPRFVAATFTPEWYVATDPAVYTRRLADIFRDRGGAIEIGTVRALSVGQKGVRVVLQDDRTHATGHVVVCAGAWAHLLARTVGDRIPLETERGYNVTLPAGALDLRTQITFGGHGFVVTSVGSGVRVGGGVELGGLKLPPNYARASTMLAKAKAFLPGLKDQGGRPWMGFRPSLPDSLPVIGHAAASERIVYAFGHGHLGLTQAAGTAALVADLVARQKPAIDLTPFRPNRF